MQDASWLGTRFGYTLQLTIKTRICQLCSNLDTPASVLAHSTVSFRPRACFCLCCNEPAGSCHARTVLFSSGLVLLEAPQSSSCSGLEMDLDECKSPKHLSISLQGVSRAL